MNSRLQSIERLRGLEPESDEFYSVAAAHLWRRCLSHVNYGCFFLLLAAMSATVAFLNPGPVAVGGLLSAIYWALLGGFVIFSARQSGRLLAQAQRDWPRLARIRCLRMVAWRYRGDAVSRLIINLPGAGEPSELEEGIFHF